MINVKSCISFADIEEEESQKHELLTCIPDAIYLHLSGELIGYWDKPLSSMPEKLRLKIEHAVPDWDEIDGSPDLHDLCNRSRRKQIINHYDYNKSNVQDVETYLHISVLIRELKRRIDKDQISSNEDACVAVGLRGNVVLPLEKILNMYGITEPSYSSDFSSEDIWFNNGPSLLWADIYWYSTTLPSLIARANADKSYMLSLTLCDISEQITNIVTQPGWMDSKGYELVREVEAEEQAAHVSKVAQAVEEAERKAQEEAASKNQAVSAVVTKGKGGRPKTIDKKANAVRKIIEIFEKAAGIKFKSNALPGSAVDLLDACRRIEKGKTKKCDVFGSSTDSFKDCLKAAGYGFAAGRTLDAEKKYWTLLSVETVELFTPEVFTEVYRKTTL